MDHCSGRTGIVLAGRGLEDWLCPWDTCAHFGLLEYALQRLAQWQPELPGNHLREGPKKKVVSTFPSHPHSLKKMVQDELPSNSSFLDPDLLTFQMLCSTLGEFLH